jgi:predicted N-acetyltransferase YhbS
MLGPLIVDKRYKSRGIGRELMNKSISDINSKNINFITLIGELNYYGQFGFEINTNIYFAINVRKEKILFKKLLEKNNIISGKIELY